jgi:SNF2 family DNA or RNA helicase
MTPFHAIKTATELCTSGEENRLIAAYSAADVKIYPFQIAAANFALRSPFLKGAILTDEGSLGKTIEALLVISQMWYERREKIL